MQQLFNLVCKMRLSFEQNLLRLLAFAHTNCNTCQVLGPAFTEKCTTCKAISALTLKLFNFMFWETHEQPFIPIWKLRYLSAPEGESKLAPPPTKTARS